MRPLRTTLLALALAVAGCSMHPVYVAEMETKIPQPGELRRIEHPLFIILDPTKLPDTMTALGQGVKPIEVYGLHTFVERDLQRTMSQLFTTVTVGPPSLPAPSGIFLTGEVLVNSLSSFVGTRGPGTPSGVYVRMQWSFRIRAYGAPADAFIYQGTAESTVPITATNTTQPALQTLFEDALRRLVSHYDGQKAYERMARIGA
ncbi:hypothetical protein SAMN02745121_04568 [Nannocystis exedens]|uniref:ABC-type transport auxiliary lipoprotein component domain-containing protein n=1 Tax=Nannocystis exedens TaxID=54 RepID=A0A1I2BAS5_9BACT|nr:hypothetical protein [Nannocystis exedens]PCC68089.1 hypothetical protein NAEX_01097 [Nannocystis exedens]SFE53169.1 hypothetical protein SAMN02745121_04568 [Nannocystis exedens]